MGARAGSAVNDSVASVASDPTTDEIRTIFAANGPLAQAIPGYSARAQQAEFASDVARAIRANDVLIAEAGTGTGKTVAYLVPALLYGGKVIVSTGTKTLQDQLFHRDLPAVRDALGMAVTSALLKGRANYVCHYHLERNLQDGRLPNREAVNDLQAIARFARITQTGDRSEAPEVPEDSAAWVLATSTRENCLGQQCPNFSDCFVMKARRAALEADIVVVNHHLFFADAMLRDEGTAELLPSANTVILDEAHQLPDTASLFFGESVSTGQVLDLVRDALVESLSVARDLPELQPIIRAVEKAARDLRIAVPTKDMRLPATRFSEYPALEPAVTTLVDLLLRFQKAFEHLAERSEGMESCGRRATDLLARLNRWRVTDEPELIRWVDAYSQSLALHVTPLSVAEPFRKQLEGRPRAWILASATLAVGESFKLYQERMGLENARTARWPSPFDYAANAVLYLPTGLPEPNAPTFTDAVVEAALPVLRASGGRAFLLFTTLRGMRRAHELLTVAFARDGLTYPLLVQGQGTRTDLLDRFRALGNAVLVASASFWEGVDVRGEALSLVVIDKLPFAPPDDPVLAARLEALERAGRNAFIEYQVPQAAIALKQGAGRLIRDERDRGVLMICDMRLASRGYGKTIVASLPPMRRTRSLATVEQFFESLNQVPQEGQL
jgi:ATP-dependent DNA helicase DinG